MALLEQLTTAELAPTERLPYWNSIAQLVAPIEVEPLGEAPFEARLYRRKLRECELLSPCSSPARIYSGPDHANAGFTPCESGCSKGYRNDLYALPENAGPAIPANHCGFPVTPVANLGNMTESGAILSELS